MQPQQSATITRLASPPSTGPIIRAQGIRKSFQMGGVEIHVLKEVDLTIRTGEFIAIEGRSGSGKSTLLHVLGALDAPDAGSVEFDGQDYTRASIERAKSGIVGTLTRTWIIWLDLTLLGIAAILAVIQLGYTASHELPPLAPSGWLTSTIVVLIGTGLIAIPAALAWLFRIFRSDRYDRVSARIRNGEFGFVFQFYHLLPELDVVENTMLGQMIQFSLLKFFGRRKGLRARAKEVLIELGLAHRLTHRPSQLSGGERQRVAIARALMNNPRVLFADEPTGNLDAETGRQIMDVLEKLHREQGQTIVMVTHDRALAREADRVLVLTNGVLETAT